MLNKDLSETEYQELNASREQWDTEKQREISRRYLLKLMKIGGGVAASATLLAACGGGGDATSNSGDTASNSTTTTTATQAPTQAPTPVPTTQAAQGAAIGGKVLAKAANVPVDSAVTFPIHNQGNPGVLVHTSDGKFVAFDSTCTHEQCSVAYKSSSKLLECPCHGASFDPAKNGAVVDPPATEPLKEIKIIVSANGDIMMA